MNVFAFVLISLFLSTFCGSTYALWYPEEVEGANQAPQSRREVFQKWKEAHPDERLSLEEGFKILEGTIWKQESTQSTRKGLSEILRDLDIYKTHVRLSDALRNALNEFWPKALQKAQEENKKLTGRWGVTFALEQGLLSKDQEDFEECKMAINSSLYDFRLRGEHASTEIRKKDGSAFKQKQPLLLNLPEEEEDGAAAAGAAAAAVSEEEDGDRGPLFSAEAFEAQIAAFFQQEEERTSKKKLTTSKKKLTLVEAVGLFLTRSDWDVIKTSDPYKIERETCTEANLQKIKNVLIKLGKFQIHGSTVKAVLSVPQKVYIVRHLSNSTALEALKELQKKALLPQWPDDHPNRKKVFTALKNFIGRDLKPFLEEYPDFPLKKNQGLQKKTSYGTLSKREREQKRKEFTKTVHDFFVAQKEKQNDITFTLRQAIIQLKDAGHTGVGEDLKGRRRTRRIVDSVLRDLDIFKYTFGKDLDEDDAATVGLPSDSSDGLDDDEQEDGFWSHSDASNDEEESEILNVPLEDQVHSHNEEKLESSNEFEAKRARAEEGAAAADSDAERDTDPESGDDSSYHLNPFSPRVKAFLLNNRQERFSIRSAIDSMREAGILSEEEVRDYKKKIEIAARHWLKKLNVKIGTLLSKEIKSFIDNFPSTDFHQVLQGLKEAGLVDEPAPYKVRKAISARTARKKPVSERRKKEKSMARKFFEVWVKENPNGTITVDDAFHLLLEKGLVLEKDKLLEKRNLHYVLGKLKIRAFSHRLSQEARDTLRAFWPGAQEAAEDKEIPFTPDGGWEILEELGFLSKEQYDYAECKEAVRSSFQEYKKRNRDF